jgi:signal transduction histidine kinase
VEPDRPVRWSVTALGVAVTVAAAGWGLRQCRVHQRCLAAAPLDAGLRAVERSALTRELHQVVTHHLSTAALQVMSHLDATDVDELRSILAKVNLSVQAALAELRQVARVQRDDPVWARGAGLAARVPPTTVAARWAGRLSDAGFEVTLAVPPAVDRLRVSVQATVSAALEVACANVLRHAPARSRCSVSVEVGADEAVVSVTSALPPSATGGRGRSLRRLRERVDLSGGSSRVGPSSRGEGAPGTWLVVVAVPR